LVTREQLRDRIWPPELHLDFENSLDSAAFKVRRALDDSAKNPRLLETIPGKGFRFIGEVIAEPIDLEAAGGSPQNSAPVGPSPPRWAVWKGTGHSPDRWLGLSLLATALLLLVVLLAWSPWKDKTTPYDPHCVAVAPFENRTGDTALDSLGQQVVDFVRQDLLSVGGLQVAGDVFISPGGDPTRRLAEVTKARYVATGAYYLRGGEVEFQARVLDPWTGKVINTLGPWRGPKEDPAKALTDLRQVLGGALAWAGADRIRQDWEGLRPPRLDALQAMRKGRVFFGVDYDAALAAYREALALDPDFFYARVFLFYSYRNRLSWEEAATSLAPAEAQLGRLTPVERLMVRYLKADVEGRYLEALDTFDRLKSIHPETNQIRFLRAWYEIVVNRPRSAIRSLSGIPYGQFGTDSQTDWWPARHLGWAYHMAGDYEGQLRTAREAQLQFPDVLNFRAYEIWALAALGRLQEVDAVLQAVPSVQRRPGFVSMSPSDVMLEAVLELRAHGHPEASRRVATRLLAELQSLPPEAQRPVRRTTAYALICLDRGSEALGLLQALAAEGPKDVTFHFQGRLGALGALQARLGHTGEARQVDAELAARTGPYQHGIPTYWRACIAAQLGEKDRAVGLLAQAFGQGFYFSYNLHRDLDLEPLRGYPPYEALVKPKD
jgi:tetratricopeptide (TPR) repeat protein